MNNLEAKFLDEVVCQRMEIAFQKHSREKTKDQYKIEREQFEYRENLYQEMLAECSEEKKKQIREYFDIIIDEERENCEFNYKAGFKDGVALMFSLMEMWQNMKKE